MTKGIRGAITVDSNSEDAVKNATLLLMTEIFKQNNIDKTKISHIIFTLTNDINAAFPAKFARESFGLDDVAMLCFNEIDVPKSLKKCLRILMVINCEDDFKPQFVYMGGAKYLRKDLN